MRVPAIFVFVLAVVVPVAAGPPLPAGTAFTYQGRLKESGSLPTSAFDMTFTLWDAAEFGNQIGGPVDLSGPDAVTVTKGLFSVELDFGPLVFNGEALWLEITIDGGPDPLTPRQPITSTPYALHAATPWETDPVTGDAYLLDGDVGIGTTETNLNPTVHDRSLVISAGTLEPINVAGLSLQGVTGTPDSQITQLANYNLGQLVTIIATNRGKSEDSGYLRFLTKAAGQNITERMRVDAAGNVGIGTADPVSPLHVVAQSSDQITMQSNSGFAGLSLMSSALSNDFRTLLTQDPSSGTLQVRVGQGPDGVSGSGDSKLNIMTDGTVVIPGCLTATMCATRSDARLKRDIRELDGALDAVLALRGVSYEWSEEHQFPVGRHIGLIAQEVREVVPEVVTGDEDSYYAVSYDSLVPVLIEAVKELDGIVEAKDERIAALERQNEDLNHRLLRLEQLVLAAGGEGSR